MGRRGDLEPRRVRKTVYALVQAQRCQNAMRERLNDFIDASKQPQDHKVRASRRPRALAGGVLSTSPQSETPRAGPKEAMRTRISGM